MRIQENISAELQENKVGERFKVIIDRLEGNFYVGRTEYDSPEVDPEVLICRTGVPELQIGEFYNVKIDGTEEFDLYAHVV